MNKSLADLMRDILTQISEQFEESVLKVTKRLADLAKEGDENNAPSTDTLDGAKN